MFRPFTLSLLLPLLLAACAVPPKGGDIASDIHTYAYQNRPRALAAGETIAPFNAGQGGAAIASSDVPWRVPPACRVSYRGWLSERSQPVADQEAFFQSGQCPLPPKNAFIGVAISGGGNKSAVYSSEVLFELARYGLADDIDVISSVSGGSFTAMLYALSCQPGPDCDADTAQDADKIRRPRWDYKTIRQWTETNYFWPLVGHRFRPDNLYRNWFEHHGADDDLAVIVGSRLLKETDRELTFKDLNPSRPNLIINASNVTVSRPDFDREAAIPDDSQRPLTDDSALHFSFTQQYFWRLLSNLDDYPLKEAVTGSAAFPLIIDRPSLRQFRPADLEAIRNGQNPLQPPKYIALFDGGVHDNFGVTELQWLLECQMHMPASLPDVGHQFYLRSCGTRKHLPPRPPAIAFVFGINSSLLRSSGSSDIIPKQRSLDTYLLPVRISGVSESVDMIMGASGEQRKQQLRRLMRNANPTTKRPGYRDYDPDNPALTYGPYQYVDFDLEAAQILYCYSGDPKNPGTLGRDGTYEGRPPSGRLINAATGGSDASRCEGLRGVLRWNDTTGPNARNLQLPEVLPGFCARPDDCQELEPLIGNSERMAKYVDGRPTRQVDLSKVFFDPEMTQSPRLLRNSLLFDAVRDVPTNFKLDARYAWLLRYTARWVVAHRIWRLCEDNAAALQAIGKYERACKAPFPPRDPDDRVGSAMYLQADF